MGLEACGDEKEPRPAFVLKDFGEASPEGAAPLSSRAGIMILLFASLQCG